WQFADPRSTCRLGERLSLRGAREPCAHGARESESPPPQDLGGPRPLPPRPRTSGVSTPRTTLSELHLRHLLGPLRGLEIFALVEPRDAGEDDIRESLDALVELGDGLVV